MATTTRRGGRLSAQPRGDLVAVESRHADVEKDEVRPQAACGLERGEAVVDDRHRLPECFQDRRAAVREIDVVVGDEHAVLRHGRGEGGGGAGSGGGSSPRSSRTTNSEPWPSPALCTAMLPPCSSISCRRA
jgi:hypothetical protein